jgi:hypothetical protein
VVENCLIALAKDSHSDACGVQRRSSLARRPTACTNVFGSGSTIAVAECLPAGPRLRGSLTPAKEPWDGPQGGGRRRANRATNSIKRLNMASSHFSHSRAFNVARRPWLRFVRFSVHRSARA